MDPCELNSVGAGMDVPADGKADLRMGVGSGTDYD